MNRIPSETSFFRDAQVFEALRTQIFPHLLRRKNEERCLNIWSAACSNGQEAYSLAMLLYDSFPVFVNNWNLQILASDVSEELIAKARSGTYSDLEIQRRLPKRLVRRYFQRQGNDWVVSNEIRLMVQFRRIDLRQPLPPLPSMDLILLRNLLIYFDLDHQNQILERVSGVLKPDGYLLLGVGETLTSRNVFLPAFSIDGATFYQIHPANDVLLKRSLENRK